MTAAWLDFLSLCSAASVCAALWVPRSHGFALFLLRRDPFASCETAERRATLFNCEVEPSRCVCAFVSSFCMFAESAPSPSRPTNRRKHVIARVKLPGSRGLRKSRTLKSSKGLRKILYGITVRYRSTFVARCALAATSDSVSPELQFLC